MLCFIFLTCLTLTYLYYFTSDFRRRRKLLEKFPGPRKLPLLGNVLDFPKDGEGLQKLLHLHEQHGSAIYLRAGLLNCLVFSDAKSFEFFLSSPKIIDKSRSYKFLHSWLGAGLLTSGGAKWKLHRKIITPTFHFTILEDFVDVFNSVVNVLIEKLDAEIGEDSTDIFPYITLCTLDMICETAMGVSVNAQNDSDSEYVHSVKEMCRIMITRDRSLLSTYDFFYRFTKDYSVEIKCLQILHGFTKRVITQRRKELTKETKDAKERNEFGIRKKKTFLDLLFEARGVDGERALTDEEIREQVDTFMFEAHDTTAAAITFTIYSIANHPHVQEVAVKELSDIFGNDVTRSATFQDLYNMKYLECVIKESLRLYPSVPIIGRRVLEDLEFEGKIIPKETDVGLFIYGIHRDPELFPDPLKFDPQRFFENFKQQPYCYVPFSAGPRNCIGQKFAMLEMKSTVSKILRHYELLPAIPEHNPVLISEAVLKSYNGVRIRLRKRLL